MVTYSEEAQEYIEIGTLNGLFVLGRTMGFIGEQLHNRLSYMTASSPVHVEGPHCWFFSGEGSEIGNSYVNRWDGS